MSQNIRSSQSNTSGSVAPSRESEAPLLPDEISVTESTDTGVDGGGKTRKRDFFRFGRKTEDDKKKGKADGEGKPPTLTPGGGLHPRSPNVRSGAVSPTLTHPYGSPASPGRQALRSASPRTHSPASSMIFERSVQEEVPPATSPQIPSHIHTENHIAPALDATSEAITDAKLDPDTVEIVTHATHQPAAAAIPGHAEHSLASSAHEDFSPLTTSFLRQESDNVSNYGSLETGDVRRLSFISFADVVHAEHELEGTRRDSAHLTSLSGHPALASPRSPSPVRSPSSSQVLGTSPSTSITPSFKEASPTRALRNAGSPLPGASSPVPVGEVKIETMRQALRTTASGDFSALRSPVSESGVDQLDRAGK